VEKNEARSCQPNGQGWKTVAGYLLTAGVGAGIGAGAMFLCDRHRGRARRNQLRDQMSSAFRSTATVVSKHLEDAGHRAKGLVFGARGKLLRCETEVPDAQLAGRVRAKLGHLTQEARKVRVDVHRGHIALYGHLKEAGFEKVVAELASIPGVRSIDDYTYSAPPKPRGFRPLARVAAVPAVLGLSGILAGVRALAK
jgi:hypothetical protein